MTCDEIDDVREPWNIESPPWVFCEDTSTFRPEYECQQFKAETVSPFASRYVQKLTGVRLLSAAAICVVVENEEGCRMAGSHGDTAFRRLIDALFDEQQAAWSEERPGDMPSKQALEAKSAIRSYQRGWQELSDARMLPTKQPNVVKFEPDRYLMPLPPLQKDDYLVPLLSISYEHSDRVGAKFEEACCRIYVLMLGKDEDNHLVGIGFRIEGPERNCQKDANVSDKGLHDFYHAQLIKRIRTYGPEFNVPDWLPCKQPSFPLWAINPVDALLNLILTLYGASYYQEFLRNYGSRFSSAMSEEFKLLNKRLNRGK